VRAAWRRLRLANHRWNWCGPGREPDGPDGEWTCNTCGDEFYVLPLSSRRGWRWDVRQRTP
jgi:hypothetical protein